MHLWWKIIHSLREMVLARCELKGGMDLGDVLICNHLNFPLQGGVPVFVGQCYNSRIRHPVLKINREGHWTPPLPGVLKVNTDGSSQGNPGPAGIGGVGRSFYGEVQFLFSVYKGFHTNNYMEALAILFAPE